ncbi:YidB family protein [Methylobacterium sp. P5_C11]
MSLLNSLGGSLGQMALKALPGVIQQVLPGGLNALLDQLRRSGYENQVNSWLGRGPNEPITADDLRKVLDNEQVRHVQSRGEMGWVVSEPAWVVCPGSAGRFVWREAA